MLGLAASFLAGIAALAATQTGNADYAPFFIGLCHLGGIEAWAARESRAGHPRMLARAIAIVWLVAATWVAVLLAWELTYYAGSRPPPEPGRTYLGIPVTAYYLVGLYGGAALVTLSAFRRAGRAPAANETAPSVPPRTP